jgi:uncharacterized membrane protein YfcA
MEVVLGFLIAVAVGMTGMGGGVLAAPALILFAGMPAFEAVGTSLVFVTVVKLSAAPIYILRQKVDWGILLRLLLGGIPGVVLGSILISRLSERHLEPVILSLVGFTILVIALVTLFKMIRSNTGETGTDRKWLLPFLSLPIGLEVGFSSAGAGALGSLVLMHATSLSTATVVGTDMLFGWLVAMAGSGVHLSIGQVNAAVVLKLVAGGIAGAILGSWLATWVPSRPLRFGLTCFLVLLGSQLLWKGIGGL